MDVVVFFIGWLAGGVINALADALPFHRAPYPPSCPHCGATRPTKAWLALLAFTLGSKRCPACQSVRTFRSIGVELSAAILAVLVYRSAPTTALLLTQSLQLAVFLLLVVIDIEHRLILHITTIPSMVAFGVLFSFDPAIGPVKTLAGGLGGFAIVFGLYLLGGLFVRLVSRLRKQELDEVAFGFGDVMLAGLIGLMIGWPGVILALILGILSAGVFSMVYILVNALRRKYTPFQPIPYGPFLILGALFISFGGADLLRQLLLP